MTAIAFYAALGVALAAGSGDERTVACFACPERHANADATPSCSVNVHHGAFYCHGCGTGGGAYDAAVGRGLAPLAAMDLLRAHGLVRGDHTGRARGGHQAVGNASQGRSSTLAASTAPPVAVPSRVEVSRWAAALAADTAMLTRLRDRKGWQLPAITEFGIGWDGERITIPIRDGHGAVVNLVRYRPGGGTPKSCALRGRERALFPAPEWYAARDLAHPVYIVEGEPDAISARSFGLVVVGVPGATGWKSRWASRFDGLDVRILADHDAPGARLGAAVASDLASHAASVDVLSWSRVVDPAKLCDGYDFADYAASIGSAAR